MNVGELIKYHRINQKLSMSALARLADIAQSGLSDIEAGKRQPNFDLLEKVVGALNLTWTEFFQEIKPEMAPELRRLVHEASNLTTEQLEALICFLKTLKGPGTKND